MGSPVRFGFLFLFLLASSLHAQSPPSRGDYHTLEDEGRRLYSVSAFAHGHRHGYESGYHLADEEIHFGLRQRDLNQNDVPHAMKFKSDFGDKKVFRQGFVHGFLAGYRDSYAREPFRVPEWLQEVPPFAWMNDLPQADGATQPTRTLRRAFDNGARMGYESGLLAPLGETAALALGRRAGEACSATPESKNDGFCDGFRQGFLLAVRDRAPAPAMAERPALAQSGSQPH